MFWTTAVVIRRSPRQNKIERRGQVTNVRGKSSTIDVVFEVVVVVVGGGEMTNVSLRYRTHIVYCDVLYGDVLATQAGT